MTATDYTFTKGFRTGHAYFPESVFGKYSITSSNCLFIGGKVRGVNWSFRRGIMQTGNIGDGRNLKNQVYTTFDANASVSWEVIDFSFLRFGMGDVSVFEGEDSGLLSSKPYYMVESELCGVDAPGNLATGNTTTNNFSNIRIRPFSMVLFDIENSSSAVTPVYNETIDYLTGCMINDFSLSASIGTPLTCNTNMIVRKVEFGRFRDATLPDPSSTTPITTTFNKGFSSTTTAKASKDISEEVPLMFFQGEISSDGFKIGNVTSFSMSYANNFLTFRTLGDPFIQMPQTGMRKFSLNLNMIFALPPGDIELAQGIPTTKDGESKTTILEYIKKAFGYSSNDAFAKNEILSPEFLPDVGTVATSTNKQIKPDVNNKITLEFNTHESTRGGRINIYNAAVANLGRPVVLEQGLIEIPIAFDVIGYPFVRMGDGSYSGYMKGDDSGIVGTYAAMKPVVEWWLGKNPAP